MLSTQRWDPEGYAKSSAAQQRWAQELLSKISIGRDDRILDIGCGDGKVTAEIALHVPDGSVLGIDNSVEMISFAQSKFPPTSWPNLTFQYGDASHLHFVDEFDLVLSFACLHWVLDHRPVLEGIKRSLKQGGKALMQFGGRDNAAAIFKVVDEIISEGRWSGYFEGFKFPYGLFGPDEYMAWLDRAGLSASRVELVQKDMIQNGRDGLASWLKSTWLPYIEKVPGDLREDLIYEVVDRYVLEHPPDGEGFVHVGMVRLEVEAEKNRA